jgi:acetyl-CoA acetyltransferase family protein
MSKDIVIIGAKRTPFGSFGGSLKYVSANDLGAAAARAAIAQAGIAPDAIDQVIFGNVLQTSGDAIYHARHVGLKAGVPQEVPALTVNRLCGSGFQSVVSAAEQILLGQADVVLAGGAENMSMAPHVVRARWGVPFGQAPMTDALWESLTDSYCGLPMAITAENLAAQYAISREDADEYGLRSQTAYAAAWEAGVYSAEIEPYRSVDRRGRESIVDRDECPRADTDAAKLAKLRPVFKADGVVTAGNASAITDGAAALVVTSAERAAELGATALARVVSWGVVGVDPSVMGIGPVEAIRQALERAGLTLNQMDRVEVNEAFAPQYLAVEKELGLDRARTNVNGGAISVGHPLGASGARITAHLCYELARTGGRYAVGSACIGGGQGIAIVLERC